MEQSKPVSFVTLMQDTIFSEGIFQNVSIALVEIKDSKFEFQYWDSYSGKISYIEPDVFAHTCINRLNRDDSFDLRKKVSHVCNIIRDYSFLCDTQYKIGRNIKMLDLLTEFESYLRHYYGKKYL